jgi:hypothetical protein
VEVSDGTDNVTVRKVYAEDCVYAVDVQDHKAPGQINSNVFIQDVFARRCTHAIRTANRPLGHANLAIDRVTAEHCAAPLMIRNTDGVILRDVTIVDHASRQPPIALTNCRALSVRDVTIKGGDDSGPAVVVTNCDEVLVDGITLRVASAAAALCYRVTSGATFSGLRVRNVFAPRSATAGILLERDGERGTLTDYLISGNVARVLDRIRGERAVIVGNGDAEGEESARSRR